MGGGCARRWSYEEVYVERSVWGCMFHLCWVGCDVPMWVVIDVRLCCL